PTFVGNTLAHGHDIPDRYSVRYQPGTKRRRDTTGAEEDRFVNLAAERPHDLGANLFPGDVGVVHPRIRHRHQYRDLFWGDEHVVPLKGSPALNRAVLVLLGASSLTTPSVVAVAVQPVGVRERLQHSHPVLECPHPKGVAKLESSTPLNDILDDFVGYGLRELPCCARRMAPVDNIRIVSVSHWLLPLLEEFTKPGRARSRFGRVSTASTQVISGRRRLFVLRRLGGQLLSFFFHFV